MDTTTGQDRTKRVPPGTKKSTLKKEKAETPSFRLTLLAPNHTDYNTVRLTTWVEVKVVNDRGRPLADERCVLWAADGQKREKRTNKEGVVFFANLPLFILSAAPEDLYRPAFQLPDVLEEWPEAKIGPFTKPDQYRRMDGMVTFVPTEHPKYEVTVNHLTEEQKYQHFYHQYVDNNARYWSPGTSARHFDNGNKRWKWQHGAVCNQHVNFFLGYWFNYNNEFSKNASASYTLCLPLYSSDHHSFKVNKNTVKHRGYLEFVDPVPGFGTKLHPNDAVPDAAHCAKAFQVVEYIRISKYFDRDTGEPTEAGKALFSALGNFNFYSLSDFKKQKQQKAAVTDVCAWLKKHKDENGYTDKQIDKMGKGAASKIWDIVWNLDDDDETDQVLIKKLRNHLEWDHHAGLLLKRAPGGGEPAGDGDELYTFSADGSKSSKSGPIIKLKQFSTMFSKKFLHLGIWRTKSLRPGGYAPLEAEENEGQISIDEPSRFVFWV